ncbi:MAG: hypothetical protein MUD08_09065 [Cytophagales bacterium]|jgi:hypothetical protein|nr:hypothetical protein [Cytophagales bacterium]
MKVIFLFISLFVAFLPVLEKNTKTSVQQSPLRVGKHNLTLQWISWDVPGTAVVSQKNGKYFIKGNQKSKTSSDSLYIEGELKVVNSRELLFTGKIVTHVASIHSGQPCVKEGEYHFKATGTRKYWRLQEMESCEGNNVVDYVDIYF